MAYNTCLFAVAAPSPDAVALAERRVARLARWFDGLAPTVVRAAGDTRAGVVAGAFVFGAGEPRPSGDGGGAAVLEWGVSEVGPGARLDVAASGAVFRTAATDITAGYRCRDAISTHAVVAAFLGSGEVGVRPAAVPELLAFGHPANLGHVVAGITAVGAGSECRVDGRGLTEAESPGRWELVAEERAYAEVVVTMEAALERSAATGSLALGLSGGRDSRVVAVALRALGLEASAYTLGAAASAECREASSVARVVGLPHSVIEPSLLPDEDVAVTALRDARWTEGCAPARLVAGQSRLGADVNLTGAGGELGRAFHYAYTARNFRRPSLADLASVWRPQARLDSSIAAPARDAVAAAASEALERAAATGVTGWRTLDVVYAQQRMRRWGRTGIAPTSGVAYAPVFLDPQVAAALVSLPLVERLTDGFHRRYLSERMPELVPPKPRRQRAAVPSWVRRAVAQRRGTRRPAEPGASPLPRTHPQTHAHLVETVARHPLVVDQLGAAWGETLQRALRAGDGRAVDDALLLAGPVALAEAIRSLNQSAERELSA